MRGIDFSSWQSIVSTVLGFALIALIGIAIRLLAMFTIQQRRERLNRQINERLRTLIAAYKTLGGSFTGQLEVDPTHLRDLRRAEATGKEAATGADAIELSPANSPERNRRIRDAVEAALSDVILLGTEDHVRLAEGLARELVAGRPVHTGALVVSLRNFIREALDLDPIPGDLAVPMQGPLRPPAAGGGRGRTGNRPDQGGGGRGDGGGGAGGGMGMGGAAGLGIGIGAAGASASEDEAGETPARSAP